LGDIFSGYLAGQKLWQFRRPLQKVNLQWQTRAAAKAKDQVKTK